MASDSRPIIIVMAGNKSEFEAFEKENPGYKCVDGRYRYKILGIWANYLEDVGTFWSNPDAPKLWNQAKVRLVDPPPAVETTPESAIEAEVSEAMDKLRTLRIGVLAIPMCSDSGELPKGSAKTYAIEHTLAGVPVITDAAVPKDYIYFSGDGSDKLFPAEAGSARISGLTVEPSDDKSGG